MTSTPTEAPPIYGRFREDYLGYWVAEDDTKSLLIRRDESGELWLTVWRGVGESPLRTDLPAKWHDARPEAAKDHYARHRVGYLQAELGVGVMGTTYDLMFGAENTDPKAWADFMVRPVGPADPIEAVGIYPEGGPSLFDALVDRDDETAEELRRAQQQWVEPLSTYRAATAAQLEKLRAAGR